VKQFALLFVITFYCGQTIAQSNWQQFKNQPGPLKRWALLHPFKAKKAFEISLEVNKVSDSLSKLKVLDGDKAGGQIDAFRHAYWMARLQVELGKCATKSLGKSYEKGNYRSYKKNEKVLQGQARCSVRPYHIDQILFLSEPLLAGHQKFLGLLQ